MFLNKYFTANTASFCVLHILITKMLQAFNSYHTRTRRKKTLKKHSKQGNSHQ